jgi:hypothetical protein
MPTILCSHYPRPEAPPSPKAAEHGFIMAGGLGEVHSQSYKAQGERTEAKFLVPDGEKYSLLLKCRLKTLINIDEKTRQELGSIPV